MNEQGEHSGGPSDEQRKEELCAVHGLKLRVHARDLAPAGAAEAIRRKSPTDQHYGWAPGARIGELGLAPLPAWLLITLLVSPIRPAVKQTVSCPTSTTRGPVTRLDLTQLASGVSEGQRDDRLFRLACHLRWRGYPREQAEQIVIDAAGRCRPPFPTSAALRKVASAWRYST